MTRRTLMLVALCLAASVTRLDAQQFPSRPITLAVPTPPGGPMDTMMRAVAEKMAENMGQPVVVENKTGAGGVLASQSALSAPPDGHTIAAIYLSHATNVHFNQNLPYDTLKAFTPIILVAKGPLVLLVNKNVPAKNVAELIAYAKANPGKLNIGASAMGGASHLGGELFKSMAGLTMETVPYRGTAAMISDILSDRVQVTIDSYLQYVPHAQSGAIRFLAVSTAQRFEIDPSIPSIAETIPGYETLAWWGLAVSSATPPEVSAKLNREAARALEDKGVQDRIRALGISPGGGTSAEFDALIRAEMEKWGKLIRSAKLVAQ